MVERGNEPEFCDTVLGGIGGGGAQFTALMQDANSYVWQIGTDTKRFNGKQIGLKFTEWLKDTINNLCPNVDFYKPIPITLFLRNKPSSCISATDTSFLKRKTLFLRAKFFITEGSKADVTQIIWRE